jgi:hypothetical protein
MDSHAVMAARILELERTKILKYRKASLNQKLATEKDCTQRECIKGQIVEMRNCQYSSALQMHLITNRLFELLPTLPRDFYEIILKNHMVSKDY